MNLCVKVGARGSPLSKKQVEEVLQELQKYHPLVSFDPIWITTTGDLDRTSSLRNMPKNDFFTKEIDEKQLQGQFRISIHSAKDLPDPIREGLAVVAITKGLTAEDSLLVSPTFSGKGKIATSSIRRELTIQELYPEATTVDIRGNIHERIATLERGEIEGVVMAECALIRLGLTHLKRLKLPPPYAEGQGQLAIIAQEGDSEMKELFSCMHSM